MVRTRRSSYDDAPAPRQPDSPHLNRIKLREEYVALTADTARAILLEAAIKIYPSAIREDEVAEVAMFRDSAAALRRHLKALVKRGWLYDAGYVPTRYRVDLVALSRDLKALGYELPPTPDADYKGGGGVMKKKATRRDATPLLNSMAETRRTIPYRPEQDHEIGTRVHPPAADDLALVQGRPQALRQIHRSSADARGLQRGRVLAGGTRILAL